MFALVWILARLNRVFCAKSASNWLRSRGNQCCRITQRVCMVSTTFFCVPIAAYGSVDVFRGLVHRAKCRQRYRIIDTPAEGQLIAREKRRLPKIR